MCQNTQKTFKTMSIFNMFVAKNNGYLFNDSELKRAKHIRIKRRDNLLFYLKVQWH